MAGSLAHARRVAAPGRGDRRATMAGPIGFALDRSDRGLRRRRAARAVVFITLPVLVLSLFLSAWFVKGMMAGAIKG